MTAKEKRVSGWMTRLKKGVKVDKMILWSNRGTSGRVWRWVEVRTFIALIWVNENQIGRRDFIFSGINKAKKFAAIMASQ